MVDETSVVLDGCIVPLTLTPICPQDVDALRAWFGSVSQESRYLRFQAHVTELSPELWRYLTHVDGHDHVALVARAAGAIVGVGRWIRDARDRELAEIAFLVDDAHQRRGIGRALRDALIAAARARGIRRLRAYALPSNRGIRRLLDTPALGVVAVTGQALELALDLALAGAAAGPVV